MSLYDSYLTSQYDPQIDQLAWYDQDLISLIFANSSASSQFSTSASANVIITAQSSAAFDFLTSGTLSVAILATSAVTANFATDFTATLSAGTITAQSAITFDFSTVFLGAIQPQIFVVVSQDGSLSQPPSHNTATIAGVHVDVGAIIAVPIGSGQIIPA